MAVDAVVLSTQHSPDIEQEALRAFVKREIIEAVLPSEWLSDDTNITSTPPVSSSLVAQWATAGLRDGRSLSTLMAAWRAMVAVPSRQGSVQSRPLCCLRRSYVAKNIVAAGLADRCEIQVSYAIGVAEPTSISIDTFGTAKVAESTIIDLVRTHFDLRPKGLINMLDLKRPIYRPTAAYGHFGREQADFTWERTDKADALRAAAGFK